MRKRCLLFLHQNMISIYFFLVIRLVQPVTKQIIIKCNKSIYIP